MNYKINKLSSGLRVLTVPMPSLESVTITIWVKTGSRNETKKTNGVSHFLEHMVFKGSNKRPSAKQISTLVDSFGGEFNAATSKDWTNFYIKSPSINVDLAMDVLSDMVFDPLLKAEEIEREKGTIVEEIRMYEDTPMYRIGDIFEQLAFSGARLGWDIAGSEETVRGLKRDDFVNYRNLHYYPENILVTVSGAVNEAKVMRLVQKYFGHIAFSNPKKLVVDKVYKHNQKSPRIKLYSRKKEQAHFIIGFMSEGREYQNKYTQSVLSAILGAGMSSRLFLEVRERRGLAYSIRTSMERYQEVGYMGTYAGVDVKKADEAVKIILDQSYGLADGKYKIDEGELTKAKGYIKGHLALALEDTKDVGSFFGEQGLFVKKIRTPEDIFAEIDKVTIFDVLAEAKKLFVPKRLNLAIIGPYNKVEKFNKIIEG